MIDRERDPVLTGECAAHSGTVRAVVGPADCPFCGFDDCYLSERDECIVGPACGAKGPTDWKRFGDTELIPLEMWERRANVTEHRQGARQGGLNE